jgi:hypothetical protein
MSKSTTRKLEPLRERRLDALYAYRNRANSTQQKELLDFLLATASHKRVKLAIEVLGILV